MPCNLTGQTEIDSVYHEPVGMQRENTGQKAITVRLRIFFRTDIIRCVENSQGFPVKTLIINVTGAFVIGIVAAAAAKNTSLDPGLVLFLKVGICGGFTTFSTFAYETGIMMEKGQIGLALLYVILSAVFGVLAVFAGQMLVK